MLQRIQTTMAAIRTKLSNDSLIKKLLLHDGNDALYIDEPLVKTMNDYITLKPVFEFENQEEYDHNSMINIYMTQAIPTDDVKQVDAIIQVNIVCNRDVWDLVDNKIRPIEIANQIIKLVHNCKFTVSNKLVWNNMTDLIINKKMYGYALLFEITDGSSNNDKF